MSEISELRSIVAQAIGMLNAIIQNSKTNEELPVMDILDAAAILRVSIAGASKSLVLQNIIDAARSSVNGLSPWEPGVFTVQTAVIQNDKIYLLSSGVSLPFESADFNLELAAGSWILPNIPTTVELVESPNTPVFDLGDITDLITDNDFVTYINTNGDQYDLTDTTKTYFFRFIKNNIDYLYAYNSEDGGFVQYGVGTGNTMSIDYLNLFFNTNLSSGSTGSGDARPVKIVSANGDPYTLISGDEKKSIVLAGDDDLPIVLPPDVFPVGAEIQITNLCDGAHPFDLTSLSYSGSFDDFPLLATMIIKQVESNFWQVNYRYGDRNFVRPIKTLPSLDDSTYTFIVADRKNAIVVTGNESLEFILNSGVFSVGTELEITNDDALVTFTAGSGITIVGNNEVPHNATAILKCTAFNLWRLNYRFNSHPEGGELDLQQVSVNGAVTDQVLEAAGFKMTDPSGLSSRKWVNDVGQVVLVDDDNKVWAVIDEKQLQVLDGTGIGFAITYSGSNTIEMVPRSSLPSGSYEFAFMDDIAALLDGVATPGNTFLKLYNLILGASVEVYVADIAARNAYNVPHLPFSIFVTDDGDGKWAKYQATSTGVGATFVKLSDPDLLNAVMSASAIKTAYEGNFDTNAYTNAEKAKLGGIASGATANDTDANLKNRSNHTGTQTADTITDGTTNKVYTATEKQNFLV